MSVYKEAKMCIKAIEAGSKQIFSDACDFGAVFKKDDDIFKYTKMLVDWYGLKATRNVVTYSTGSTTTCIVEFMPNEHMTPEYVKYMVTVIKCQSLKGYTGYVYVDKIK